MIRRLRGVVAEVTAGFVVLDVGGVGYLVHTASAVSVAVGEELTLNTYLVVRENVLDLYGFVHADELAVFELLLTLPKIGPKSAAGILAHASLPLLAEAVAKEDPGHLSKLSGLGKKTAETVVVGLKDKLDFLDASSLGDVSAAPQWQHETVDALIALGYPQKDARDAVAALPRELTSTSEALTAALRQLGSV